VCGAAYDWIGIPACVATARLAASQIRAYLAGRGAATAASEMADNGGTGTIAGPDGGMAAETDGGD
jgi:hypothetical protein